MAAPIVLGSVGSLKGRDEGEEWEFTEKDQVRTIPKRCQWSEVSSLVTPLLSSIEQPWPENPNLVLKKIRVVREKSQALVWFEYGPPRDPPAKDGQLRSSTNMVQIPIEQHPSYDPGWAESKKGVQGYMNPQPTVTRTLRYDLAGFSWTQANIIGAAGKRQAPPFVSGAAATHWLFMSRDIQYDGSRIEVTDTWQYASNGWDTDIYPAA
jgi:hypothetical protein